MVDRKDTEGTKVEQLQTTFRCILYTTHKSIERNSQFVLRTLQIRAIDLVLLYNSIFITIRKNPRIPHEDFC